MDPIPGRAPDGKDDPLLIDKTSATKGTTNYHLRARPSQWHADDEDEGHSQGFQQLPSP